jgi:phosphoglycerol transferase MdoB-like AlkP superfamily enzyme
MLYAYIIISRLWVSYGGRYLAKELFMFEIPLILTISLISFFFNPNRSKKLNFFSAIIAVTPVLSIYLVYDIFYIYFGRSLRLSDVQNLTDLFHAHIYLFFALICLVFFLLVGIAMSAYFWHTDKPRGGTLTGMIPRCFILILIPFILFSISNKVYSKFQEQEHIALFLKNIKNNGRIASILSYSQRQRESRNKLKNINVEKPLNPFNQHINKKRNINIIMLESFIDPRLIANIKCDRLPIYEGMKEYLGEDMIFDMAISPIIGGHTAQSMFEVLSGVPAMGRIESTEFNALDGSKIYSFVNALKENGYKTVATIGIEYNFYNYYLAHKSLGFDEIHFLDKSKIISIRNGDPLIFDGDLLQGTQTYMNNKYISNGIPVINFALGVDGHIPFRRNKKLRPDVIKCTVDGKYENDLNDIVHISYYRTRAIYDYLNRLRRSDPNAITLIVSDHVPYLQKPLRYIPNRFNNIVLLLDRGKVIRIDIVNYYKLPYIIMSLLVGNNIKASTDEEFLIRYYFETMALGSGIVSPPKSRGMDINGNNEHHLSN